MVNISAIDVGSNAMRMVIGEVDEAWQVHSIENIPLPVRLEEEVRRFHQRLLKAESTKHISKKCLV